MSSWLLLSLGNFVMHGNEVFQAFRFGIIRCSSILTLLARITGLDIFWLTFDVVFERALRDDCDCTGDDPSGNGGPSCKEVLPIGTVGAACCASLGVPF
jgi:hypothetical protein